MTDDKWCEPESYVAYSAADAKALISALETSRELNRLKDETIARLTAELHAAQELRQRLDLLLAIEHAIDPGVTDAEKLSTLPARVADLRAEVSRFQAELNRVVAASVPREVWQAECDGHAATARRCAELEKQHDADGRRVAELESFIAGIASELDHDAEANAPGADERREYAKRIRQAIASERGGGG